MSNKENNIENIEELIPDAVLEFLKKEPLTLLKLFRTGLSASAQILLNVYLYIFDNTDDPDHICISFTKDECDKILGVTEMTTEVINALCEELIMPVSFVSYTKEEDVDEKSETMTLSVYETSNSKRIKKDYTLCCSEPTEEFFVSFNLITATRISIDDENDSCKLIIYCSEIAKKYIFTPENIAFLKKELENIDS